MLKRAKMRIVNETADLMELKDRNILGFLVFIIFIVMGAIILLSPDFLNAKPSKIWGGVFLVLSLLALLSLQTMNIRIDKSSNRVSISRKSIIKNKKEEYEISQIAFLEIQQTYRKKGFGYILFLILKTGEQIRLTESVITKRGMSGVDSGIKVLGSRIAEFLNVKFEGRRAPSLSETFSTIHDTIQKEIEKTNERLSKEGFINNFFFGFL